MVRMLLLVVVCIGLLPIQMRAQKNSYIIPGEVWKDTDGNPINAHGGGLLYHDGTYYWYGEYKKGKTILPDWATWECYRTDVTGVGCYSSKDLLNWKFEGIVLPAVKEDPNHDLHPSKVLERPKVIYNKKTGKFVMWAHVESADYSKACAGVAVSDFPNGLFTYLGSFRPNNAMSRDQTVFVDDDGRAYQFYSSENNETMYISLLTDDYLKPSGRFTRNFIKESREAPAVFKHKGKYYMLSSGCTGWDPNVAEIAVADSIMGTWKTIGNPCTGPDADKTFYAQSTYVQPVIGKKNAYIAMFDRWKKKDLEDSRYVWLPVLIKDGAITIPWHEKWYLTLFYKQKISYKYKKSEKKKKEIENRTLVLTFLLLSVSALCFSQKLVEVAKGYSCTSVNTTIFRNNSLVTHGDEQYISYYDADGYLVLGKRKLNSKQWTLHRTQYRGNVKDAHNIISIMVDGEGYLHVSFDHHGHKLNYCRSIAPGSLELGDKMPMTGVDEGNVTYPEFYPLTDGDLLFVYRSGSSGRGNLVMNRYSLKDHKWARVQDVLIDGEDKRNAYWQLYVDEKGTIHLSWVWRETWQVETNHDLCYARSFDNGVTWYKSDGEQYKLPITASNAEYACRIPQNSELINQTSMSADAGGNPYIATYWRSSDSEVPQYRIVWNDGKIWHNRQVTDRKTPFTLKGGGTKMIPVARPRIVVEDGEIFYIFRDEERGSRVSMAHTADVANGKWIVTDLTDFSVDAWEPSHDTELWKKQRKLNLFVQHTCQGDGERTAEIEPQMIYVLEANTNTNTKK